MKFRTDLHEDIDMDLKYFIHRHSVLVYFILAFFISWGGILLIIGPGINQLFEAEPIQIQMVSGQILLVFLVMLAGPSIAGLFMAGIIEGARGPRELISMVFNWKVNIIWYASALLIIPAVLLAILYLFTIFSPKFSPGSALGIGIIGGLMAGFFEEIGWTGFALPKLQLKYSPLIAGLIIGVVHTVWHLLADVWGGFGFYGDLYLLHFILWIIALTAFRLLVVWIFNHSRSLLLAQLTHASFTGSQLIFSPPSLSAAEAVTWYAVFTLALCIVVSLIIVRDRKLFTRSPDA